MQDLHGDLPAHAQVRREIDEAHAAAPDRLVEAIASIDNHTDQLGAVALERHGREPKRRIGTILRGGHPCRTIVPPKAGYGWGSAGECRHSWGLALADPGLDV